MAKLSLAKLERHLYSAADRLRQEGLDAATYKDFIFGMLFLKRCSDVFDAEREKIVAALSPLGVLDRFKPAGVIATWWTDTLPDFKTLLENGFPGVIDGWVDAIADAVEDDEAAGPAFDPFAHKLVRHTMADYLNKIATAKADIARLKGEKEAFEQSNAPDEANEEELANWNYARDFERQVRELKVEHRDALKEFARLERAAGKARATDADRRATAEVKVALHPRARPPRLH